MHLSSSLLLATAGFSAAYDAVICGSDGYSDSSNSSFSYNPNAWNPVGNGFQCLSINNDPPSFDATWTWVDDSTSVHSYPHVSFDKAKLPVKFKNITSIDLSVQWSYEPGNDATSSLQTLSASLKKQGTKANVAFDMFADLDQTTAASATQASTEIMIWIGTVGDPWPIGYSTNRTCFVQELGGVNFTLYSGTNHNGAAVYSWVSASNQTEFVQDISPLLQYLWRHGLVSQEAYLGIFEFGSEAYHAGSNVTLSASNYSMAVEIGIAPVLNINDMPDSCSSAGSVLRAPVGCVKLTSALVVSVILLLW